MKKMIFVTLISLTLVMGLIACSESNDIDVVATMQKAVAVETTNAEYYATGTAIADEIEIGVTPIPLPTTTPKTNFVPSENDENEINEAQSNIEEAVEGMTELVEAVATLAPTPTPAAEPTEVVPLRVFYPTYPDVFPYWMEKEIVDDETVRLTISNTIKIEIHTGNESGHLLPYGVTFDDNEFVVDIQSYTEKLNVERFDYNNTYPDIRQGFVLTQTGRVTFTLQEGSIVKLTNDKVWNEEFQEKESLGSVQALFTVLENQVIFLVPDFFYIPSDFPPYKWEPLWWWDETSLSINYESSTHCESMCNTHNYILDLVPYGEGSKIVTGFVYEVNHDGARLVYPRIDLRIDD